MPLCKKCNKFYPPGFVDRTKEGKECIFCQKEVNEIRYGENNLLIAKREDIILEYQKYLRMIKEENSNIKLLKRGKLEVPEKFKLE
ncbi:MAG TPA: hypothetical protein P5293_04930 [Bacteroidales bacterium]|nr:hypothetical protein [Bacteroidales bacterium]